MSVLTIQSRVIHGTVGNSVAVPVLYRLGLWSWALDTVTFSNHPGLGGFRGGVTPAIDLTDLLDGLDRLGVLAGCRVVLSGYLGAAANGAVVLDGVARAKAASPAALFVCDPVMGDRATGLFVKPDIPDFFRAKALPASDILVPNGFELERLTGMPALGVEDTLAAARSLLRPAGGGPSVVVVTGVEPDDSRIGALLVTAEAVWLSAAPKLPQRFNGSGDLFAALFAGHTAAGMPPPAALTHSVSATHAILAATLASGRDELALIAAAGDIAEPPRLFKAQRVEG